MLRHLLPTDNAGKMALITFFSTLYFYIHVNTLYLQTRGLNLLEIRTLESIIVGTIFLAEVPTSVIADRIGRKWSVVLALFLQALGEVLYLFGEDYAAFIFIAVIAGLGFAFSSGAREALVYDTLPEHDRENRMKRAMGNVGSAYQLAFFISPLVGGVLVSQLVLDEFLFVIFLTACSVTVGLLLTFTLEEPSTPNEYEPESSLTILKAGISTIRDNRKLQHFFAVTVLTATFGGTIVSLYQPLFVMNDISPFFIGAGLSFGSLLAVFTQKYAYKIEDWFGQRWGLALTTALPGLLFIGLAAAMGAPLVFAAFVLTYGTREMRSPLFSAYQNQQIPSKQRATVLSLINMVVSLYVAVMGIVLGAIAVHSLRAAFLVGGVLILGFSIVTRPDRLVSLTQAPLAPFDAKD